MPLDGFKPITGDDITKGKDWHELLDRCNQRVKDVFSEIVDDYAGNLCYDMADCESPIEQLMAIALTNVSLQTIGHPGLAIYIERQKVIKIHNATFRVDFLVRCAVRDVGLVNVIVECDGHEFHERTKEQATSDKKRDRQLLAAGYRVVRFTGSEIWADPMNCATEVLLLVLPKLGY